MKIAIFVHADLSTREGAGRVLNALHTAQEFRQAGDHIDLIFEGAGTRAAVELSSDDHHMHQLFKDVEESVTGICRFCADMNQVSDQAQSAGIALLEGNHQHPSVRNFLVNGYQILNF